MDIFQDAIEFWESQLTYNLKKKVNNSKLLKPCSPAYNSTNFLIITLRYFEGIYKCLTKK